MQRYGEISVIDCNAFQGRFFLLRLARQATISGEIAIWDAKRNIRIFQIPSYMSLIGVQKVGIEEKLLEYETQLAIFEGVIEICL